MTRYKFWSFPKKGKNMNWQKSKDKVLPVWQAQEKQQSVSVCGQPTLPFQAGEKILFFEQVKQSKRTPPTSTTQLCHLPLLSATEERNFSNQEGIFEKTSEGKFSRQRISEKISTCQQITRSLCKCLNVNLNFCETLKLIFQFIFDPQDLTDSMGGTGLYAFSMPIATMHNAYIVQCLSILTFARIIPIS